MNVQFQGITLIRGEREKVRDALAFKIELEKMMKPVNLNVYGSRAFSDGSIECAVLDYEDFFRFYEICYGATFPDEFRKVTSDEAAEAFVTENRANPAKTRQFQDWLRLFTSQIQQWQNPVSQASDNPVSHSERVFAYVDMQRSLGEPIAEEVVN